ncbi:uncharacterized protein LOC112087826 [Eutrema salsugineum]|uniref:uncharacterized protein LOC112087826 n=1 Tax=Eutrema salsugineum TaxID=72664 RepID=UPI000CED5555|nr:uncharacterized protein LOC112087826 [Eutrema salsugineum]
MVFLECAPSILQKDVKGKSTKHTLRDDDDEEDEFPSVRPGSMKPINISMPHVKSLDNNTKVAVTAILPDDEHLLDDTDFAFDDDVPDETVENLLAAISDGKKFSRKTWNGGESASLLQNQPNAPASSSRNTSSDVDLDLAASSMLEKVVRETEFVLSEIKSLRTEFVDLRSEVSSTLSTFKDYIRSQQDPSPKVREPAKRPLGRRVKSIPLRAKHVRFQQVSSSEESKSSDPSKEDDGDDGTKNKDSSSPSTESDDVVDTNVGDVVEIYDGDAYEDRREPDAEGSGDVGEVGRQMPVDVDDVQDAATLASNQIASVLSDLSDQVQVNVEPSIIQPVPSPPPYVVQPRDQTGADKDVPPVVTNEETDAAEDVPPVVTNDRTDAAKEVSPVDTNDQTGPQEDVTPVQTNDQTVPQKEVAPEPQIMLETQHTIPESAISAGTQMETGLGDDVPNAQKEIEIPAGVDPPVWSLGLKQEEKNMAQTSKTGVNTGSFATLVICKTFPSWNGIVLSVNILKEIVDLKFTISVMSIDSIIRLFRHQLAELNDDRCTYDFVEYTFLHGIAELLPHFTNPPKKKLVSLPPGSAAYVKARRSWYTQVARIYCPFQVDDRYWVGLCIDFESHEILIVNYFSARPGHLGVLALMSIQFHAANVPLDNDVGDDVVRDASLKFAYDLLCLIEPPSLANAVIPKDPAS